MTIIEQDESLVVDAAGIKDISVSVYEMNIVDAIVCNKVVGRHLARFLFDLSTLLKNIQN